MNFGCIVSRTSMDYDRAFDITGHASCGVSTSKRVSSCTSASRKMGSAILSCFITIAGPGKQRLSLPFAAMTAWVVGDSSKDSKQIWSSNFRTTRPAFWPRIWKDRTSARRLGEPDTLSSSSATYLDQSSIPALLLPFQVSSLQMDLSARACPLTS